MYNLSCGVPKQVRHDGGDITDKQKKPHTLMYGALKGNLFNAY